MALLDVDEELRVRLLRMRDAWQRTHEDLDQLYCIEVWDVTPDVYEWSDAAEDFEENDLHAQWCDAPDLDENMLGEGARTDCMTLHVTEGGVYWTWYAKHGDGRQYETPTLTWANLADA